MQGNNIIVTYDLICNSYKQFNIKLLCSNDNYTKPLTYVSGDVGSNISSGKNKKIIWDMKSENLSISGNIYFKIDAVINK